MKDNHYSWSSIQQYSGLTRMQAENILERISSLKVGIVGDACLDLYWHADMKVSELSRETPHYNMPIVNEAYFPGAAANVAVNFKDLGCAEVYLCTGIGSDWRGSLLKDTLQLLGVDSRFVLTQPGRVTPAYCKTIRHGLQDVQQEDSRIDFINTTEMSALAVEQLLTELDQMAEKVDVIAAADQLQYGIINAAVRERLQYWASQGKMIVADSRERIGSFRGLVVKPNELEALRWYNGSLDFGQPASDELIKAGLQLSRKVGAACCMTLGSEGALWCENGSCIFVPTKEVLPPVDIVGAGDTFSACLLSALGIGCSGPEALAFSHLGAAVSIRKLGRAGTAAPQEILQRFDECK
ncbi:bifunctional heptose 7-phosphate kinase/heptose 1-phosphate adenyltransferase [Paenibacillus eucommiae]|uniref:Bifunctional ADP-heptose synthase (Sugar kinase/adenylyltransferase) n=1 Tax=Paenibacillus eucommiae TaxID=1355755 RepID=A0ABS4JA35_9BACL|nr:PfkB family carbohydrate kinase [Paenibacillus eucommiae]MBP1995609.1 bifunctional ADP-heptose synthase (sugar kinase/adenylyltransferase) [Paenibacillus eucommiae]